MLKEVHIEGTYPLIALAYSGLVTEDDINSTYEIMNPALVDGEKTCLYVEMLDGVDIEGPALFTDFRRAPEIIGKLKQFERVAVVTNQDWLRAIVRLEGSLFSFFDSDIKLQVYHENERDTAIAWLKGETSYSHEPSIIELSSDDPNVSAFEVNGTIRTEDIELSKKMMVAFMNDEPPRRLLVRIVNLKGLQPTTLFDSQMIAMKQEARKHVDRYAVVGGPAWLQHLVRSMAPLFSFEIRTFELDEEQNAWDWVKERISA